MNLPTIIALVIIGGFFVFVIGLLLFRKALGTVEVTADSKIHSFGDTVKGNVSIAAKRALDIEKIVIALECTEFHQHANAGRAHSTVFRVADELTDRRTIRPGDFSEIPYSLTLPNEKPYGGVTSPLAEAENTHIAAGLQGLGNTVSAYNNLRYRWHVSVEVHTSAAVLYGGTSINVAGYTIDDRIDAHNTIKDAFHSR